MTVMGLTFEIPSLLVKSSHTFRSSGFSRRYFVTCISVLFFPNSSRNSSSASQWVQPCRKKTITWTKSVVCADEVGTKIASKKKKTATEKEMYLPTFICLVY